MFFGKKTEKIIKNKDGSEAIIEIDNLLSPIFYKNHEKLTLSEKIFVYIEELEREVNNGGFDQYFFNSSGDCTMETINALEIIGSKVFLNLLKKAVNKFPNGIVPKDRNERQKILLEITENNKELWNDLDKEFYKCEEDINKLLIDYIKNNINDFR
ncbi:MAG: DMP19 family protein [Spirochaetes bacterium]|nr:DMP19 family protein [Spirochaetota bacterium]